jgi:hypothetical protein
MKRFLLLPIALAALFTLAGCNTVNSRIEARQAAFSQLSPEDQERVRKGKIVLGDSSDAVFIALGEPDRIRKRQSAAGSDQVWIYMRTTYVNDGFMQTNYVRSFARDSKGRIVAIYYEPMHMHNTRVQQEPALRVVFQNGVVTEIEEAEPGSTL